MSCSIEEVAYSSNAIEEWYHYIWWHLHDSKADSHYTILELLLNAGADCNSLGPDWMHPVATGRERTLLGRIALIASDPDMPRLQEYLEKCKKLLEHHNQTSAEVRRSSFLQSLAA